MPIRGAEFDGTDEVSFQQRRWELRSDLPSRQRYRRKRKSGFGFKLLVLLLVAVAVYYVTDNTELGGSLLPPATQNRQAISEAVPAAPLEFTPPAATRENSAVVSRVNTTAFRTAERSGASPSVDASSPTAATENVLATAEALAPAVAPTAILPSAPDSTPIVAPLDTSKTAVVTAAEPKPSSPATPPLAGIHITQSLACMAVEGRQCIGDQSVFTLHEHNSPHIWMNVHSQVLPYVLKHIYYHEGRKYAEIPLAIKYPRMRTWSNITLQSPTRVGSWRVAIATEDGNLLDQVTFRVTP